MKVRIATSGRKRVLDFDIECRPSHWIGGDYVSREVTAIACQFVGEDEPYCWMLTKDDRSRKRMLVNFVKCYDEADMVTGHYIRNFDLPNINGALAELRLPLLQSKLTQCTKNDLMPLGGISKSQENLGGMLGLKAPKVGMDQTKWRAGNRLIPLGIEEVRERVIGDVRQHIEMRAELLKDGLLKPPRVWQSTSKPVGKYHP